MSRRPQGDLAIPGKKAKEFALVTSREDGLLRKLHQETGSLTFKMTALDIFQPHDGAKVAQSRALRLSCHVSTSGAGPGQYINPLQSGVRVVCI